MPLTEPLILTLKLDDTSQSYFDGLRKQYFPPERNFIDAHLTLFHHLPAGEDVILNTLQTLVQQQPVFDISVARVVTIGNGVAYKCESDQLQNLHKHLQRQWEQWLIPQDRQKLWPHITVQNKVSADVASATLNKLTSEFTPFAVKAVGFSLWKYMGGPWGFVKDYLFQ